VSLMQEMIELALDDEQSCVARKNGVLTAARDEIKRLEERENDLKNVLRAALAEPEGVDLVQRLTTFALAARRGAA
jgi:hypothetical protein